MKHKSSRKQWRMAGIGLVAVGALGLSGCSEIQGLLDGGEITEIVISAATNDVLLAQGVDIHRAASCSPVAGSKVDVTCGGQTAAGEEISSQYDGTTLTVSVGGKQIFSAPAQQVIDRNMEQKKP